MPPPSDATGGPSGPVRRLSPLSLRRRLRRWVVCNTPVTSRGYTLIEMLMVVVILGSLSGMAVPRLNRARELAAVQAAIADIRNLQLEIEDYELKNGQLPDRLTDMGGGDYADPWGNPYQYVRLRTFSDGKVKTINIGSARKDRFLVPLNSDYDLYSMGADGLTKVQLGSPESHDDLVRANDGGFVGLAEEY